MERPKWQIWCWYMLMMGLALLCALDSNAQIKRTWKVAELVSIDGKSLKKWNVKSHITLLDSILIISSQDDKILTLFSSSHQEFFDESSYRVFKLKGPHQSISDSLGTIYRYEYNSIFSHSDIVIMMDENITFMMLHPNNQIGVVFHDKVK